MGPKLKTEFQYILHQNKRPRLLGPISQALYSWNIILQSLCLGSPGSHLLLKGWSLLSKPSFCEIIHNVIDSPFHRVRRLLFHWTGGGGRKWNWDQRHCTASSPSQGFLISTRSGILFMRAYACTLILHRKNSSQVNCIASFCRSLNLP